MSIEITKTGNLSGYEIFTFTYIFEMFGEGMSNTPCYKCGEYKLYKEYIFIIDQLKKSGMLPKDYPCYCCKCWNEEKETNRIIKT